MKKDFNTWNEMKKAADERTPRLYTVREIWWCQLGINVGTELDGRGEEYLRPVLIVRGFGAEACLVVPLTTSNRNHPLRISIGKVEGREARVNLSQIRVIDTRRLIEKIGFLSQDIFAEVRKNARSLF